MATKKQTFLKKEPSIIANLKKQIAELQEELKGAHSTANYYKGRYEQAIEDRGEKHEEFQTTIRFKERQLERFDSEIMYLREMVAQLALSPEKLAALKKEHISVAGEDPRRNY